MVFRFDNCCLFHVPVDPQTYEDYLTIIDNPMDLSQMKTKVQEDKYWDIDRDLRADVKLMVNNCNKYNSEAPDILEYCKKFENYANQVLEKAESTLRQKYRTQAEKKARKRRRTTDPDTN